MIRLFVLLTFASTTLLYQSVRADSITIIGGSLGNGNFEVVTVTEDVQTYAQTANWFNATGDESINFTNVNISEIICSSDPGKRFGIPAGSFNFPRISVNDTGYTILQEEEAFDVSYDFLRSTGFWTGDESFRVFLFTSSAPVDSSLTESEMTVVAETIFDVPVSSLPFWENGITFNSFYETSGTDIGKTVYLGVETINPSGLPVFPGLDSVVLCVNRPVSTPMLGDVNGDGTIDLLDVAPFVELLVDGGFQIEADINEDGVVDLLDVGPFVDLLMGP